MVVWDAKRFGPSGQMAFGTDGLRASGRAQGAGTKVLGRQSVYSVQSMLPEAGGQSPGRVPGVTPWGPSVRADLHVNLLGCTTPRTLFAARGAQWPSGLPGKKKHPTTIQAPNDYTSTQ